MRKAGFKPLLSNGSTRTALRLGASQVKATEDMQEMTDSKLQKLGDLQNTPVGLRILL
jgi:hypothetical protein